MSLLTLITRVVNILFQLCNLTKELISMYGFCFSSDEYLKTEVLREISREPVNDDNRVFISNPRVINY